MKFKSTSVGPHRDDICIMVNEIDIRKFGSQGQQRTSALSLHEGHYGSTHRKQR